MTDRERLELERHAEQMAKNPDFLRTLEEEGDVTEPGRPAAEVLAPYIRVTA